MYLPAISAAVFLSGFILISELKRMRAGNAGPEPPDHQLRW
jgi:hypothetical protein